ncbi:hypothetical protein H6F89_20005 [Cyanobacteria bacterium FACHB-63]|nr:hypothetical protein [Cyanobacteria bacterium FACHB-63]
MFMKNTSKTITSLLSIGVAATVALCAFPSIAKADIRVQIPAKRHCKPYSVSYAYNKQESFPVYMMRLKAGQRFEVRNMDEYVSLVTLINPQGQQIQDFLMSAGEVGSVTVPQTGDYRIQLASDKDYYDLRFCAY